jgi:hypothetical protein
MGATHCRKFFRYQRLMHSPCGATLHRAVVLGVSVTMRRFLIHLATLFAVVVAIVVLAFVLTGLR